jgi:hypothetical protein
VLDGINKESSGLLSKNIQPVGDYNEWKELQTLNTVSSQYCLVHVNVPASQLPHELVEQATRGGSSHEITHNGIGNMVLKNRDHYVVKEHLHEA